CNGTDGKHDDEKSKRAGAPASARRVAIAVEPPIEPLAEPPPPGDRMPKPLRKPVRVAEGGLEQKRKQREHSGHGHPEGTCATRSWRGCLRRPGNGFQSDRTSLR